MRRVMRSVHLHLIIISHVLIVDLSILLTGFEFGGEQLREGKTNLKPKA